MRQCARARLTEMFRQIVSAASLSAMPHSGPQHQGGVHETDLRGGPAQRHADPLTAIASGSVAGGWLKAIDFGCAQAVQQRPLARRTGTPVFMAPEVRRAFPAESAAHAMVQSRVFVWWCLCYDVFSFYVH